MDTSGLAIIDISNPNSPGSPIYRDPSPGSLSNALTYDVNVIGDYAYLADGEVALAKSSLAIIDISDPTNPGTPSYVATNGSAFGIKVIGHYAYLSNSSSGLVIIPLNTGLELPSFLSVMGLLGSLDHSI